MWESWAREAERMRGVAESGEGFAVGLRGGREERLYVGFNLLYGASGVWPVHVSHLSGACNLLAWHRKAAGQSPVCKSIPCL